MSYQFLNKIRVFFLPYQKISFLQFVSIFFLWKLLVALIILQKSFWKNVFIDDHTQLGTKKIPHSLQLFLFWTYLCHSLSVSGKSNIVWKLRFWTFSLCENFFGILNIFWVINFGTKIILSFHKSKNITSHTQIKKLFHLWKLQVP